MALLPLYPSFSGAAAGQFEPDQPWAAAQVGFLTLCQIDGPRSIRRSDDGIHNKDSGCGMQRHHAGTLALIRRSDLDDIDLELMQMNVRRSRVRNNLGDTEASRKPVPLHPLGVKCLET